jgi:DNA-binding NarL/FixJ family response regulator
VKQILKVQQLGHKDGRNLPEMSRNAMLKKTLSDREAEVMVLIVRGYINKEIADKLNIGLTTVISHRKNIMTKLGLRSVSALTIYAVMHGYIDIDQI